MQILAGLAISASFFFNIIATYVVHGFIKNYDAKHQIRLS